ncbi:MAG: hypothetical protein AB8B97_11945 [Granulosicoccus sp.]
MTKSRSQTRTIKQLCAAAVCSASLISGAAYAADHADSPNQTGSLEARQADITDVYAFMNPNDAEELILMVLVGPDASGVLPAGLTTPNFSNAITYNVLMQNYNGAEAGDHSRIVCTFEGATPQVATCELGSLSVSGDVGGTAQVEGMRIYTGLADDPFFFNGGGLNASFAAVPPSPMFEEGANAGSPFVNANGQLNGFAGQNILAIVIGVDRDLLTNNQAMPELRLWAATAPM